jgi:hypothetical protein
MLAKDERERLLYPHLMHALNRMCLEDEAERYQTTWRLPYLDIESLAENPLLFLALLYYRTTHEPVSLPSLLLYPVLILILQQEEWMMFDNSQLKLAENFEIMIGEFNPHCVNMTGSKYGAELVKWDKERCHRWEIVGYQKAQWILSAQHHMMQFLRRTVQVLLDEMQVHDAMTEMYHDCRANSRIRVSSPKWDKLVQNSFFNFGSTSG